MAERDQLLVRVQERDRMPLSLRVDGQEVLALEGDTVLTAVLLAGIRLRESEFGDGPRSGFCLMRACQDCWMWTDDNDRIQACATFVSQGMALSTRNPDLT